MLYLFIYLSFLGSNNSPHDFTARYHNSQPNLRKCEFPRIPRHPQIKSATFDFETPQRGLPKPAELYRYQQEYEITRGLKLEETIKAYELRKYENTQVMLLEDFGGESLKILLDSRPFALPEFLRLAIQITDALGKVHQKKVIHKDINPSKIVLNPQTGQLKIIDVGLSTILSQENPSLKSPNILEGTLAYIVISNKCDTEARS
ncbi:protein kinase domain-containing protein [Microcoleus sp. B3-D7]|uniref:protein kinase domain-containing protein n=1 Tax=Microcoleus sp. B3-D7 TaxID=2818659 RepID=UPI002FCEB651